MTASEVLRKLWDLISERKLDEATELLDPNGSFWARPIGKIPMDAFIYIMKAVQTAAPMTFDIHSEMEKDELAMIEMQGHGIFSPSGEAYDNNYVFIAEVRDGLIVELREYNDSAYSNEIFGRNLSPEVSQA